MTVIRYMLQAERLPPITATLSVAEAMHSALVRAYPCALFAGKSDGGQPLKGAGHIRIYPETHPEMGVISHITLFAPLGLDPAKIDAASSITCLWGRGFKRLYLYRTYAGSPTGIAGETHFAAETPLFLKSRVWLSRTPFVGTLRPDIGGQGQLRRDKDGLIRGGPAYDLKRQLKRDGFPEPISLHEVPTQDNPWQMEDWRKFRSHRRRGGGQRGSFAPTGFCLLFEQAIPGPLSFGYARHYGLGQFWPAPGFTDAQASKAEPQKQRDSLALSH